MKNILGHFLILNIPVEDNPLTTINLFVANCKDISDYDNGQSDALCAAALDNIVSEEDLKKFFSNFGKINSFVVIEKKHLSKNFKKFAYCAYITYREKNVVEIILTYSIQMDNYFKSSVQSPYFINLEQKKFSYYIKQYYETYYDLYNERKIIINEISQINKENNKGKKKLGLVDEDGFTVVQRVADKPEFINSVFVSTNDKFSYLKRERKTKIHENFYLFQKKESIRNAGDILMKKKNKQKKS
ncbi:hypothetical protein AK88_04532 [Plasmodium fragile]|uniref:RRM domain-containing protein n=1 Tax=Plasmodium fragile TaxID=5857 RepID=A0A0D9QFJ9_PLAFR|nr:uncharacterized protein AK88_04532 [Plasmodium fragile]KJP85825.1 hypothetical protein AK88_04532 [Plasmodium fragile]